MGKRLSVITTRTGDSGTTGLGDGSRVDKDAIRIHALGDIDELNAHIGLLLSHPLSQDVQTLLQSIQHDLFDLGGELCIPDFSLLATTQVDKLEEAIHHYNSQLPRLEEFILPGGNQAAAQTHVCRTVCRRAERTLVTLGKTEPLKETTRRYINRLSDLLFVLARILNQQTGEVLWKRTN